MLSVHEFFCSESVTASLKPKLSFHIAYILVIKGVYPFVLQRFVIKPPNLLAVLPNFNLR